MSDDPPRRPDSRRQAPRRDPRAERAARRGRKPAAIADQDQEPPTASGRKRKDPRALRVGEGPGGRKRRYRGPAPEAAASAPGVETAPGPKVVIIEEPAYLILAAPDLEAGRLSDHDRDSLGAARTLADAGGGAVLAVTFEACRDDLGAAGADRVMALRGEVYEGYSPEARVAALQAVTTACQPRHLVFPDSLDGGDLGRRLAARLGAAAAGAVWRLDGARALCRADGGRKDLARPTPRVLLIAPEALPPHAGDPREARPVEAPVVTAAAVGIEDLGPVVVDPQAIALEEAPLVLAAGNGLTDWPLFHELAAALGAAEAGSRVVVDKGLVPRDRQVGASGRRSQARCYLALGISGAPQHLEGITRCERVVAINSDPACAMMARADLAVLGNLDEILPALLRLARERRRNV